MVDQANSIFVDQSENVVATIGSNYLQNFLSGGTVEKGVGILTPKRFYFKGQNFSGTGKGIQSATEEGVVSIDDITFTRFSYVRPTGLLIFAALLFLVSLVGIPLDYGYVISVPCWIAAAVLVVMFFIKRQTAFQVSFPGGSFGFDIRYYPMADIRDFQRQLHLMKDHIKENA